MRTIRVRIVALATLAVFAVLAVTAWALIESQRRTLIRNLDEIAEQRVAEIAGQFDVTDPGSLGTLPSRGDDDAISQVVFEGRVVAATANFSGRPPLAAPDGNSELRTMALLAGEPDYRVASARRGDVVIHDGLPLDDVDETVKALRRSLMVVVPISTLLLAVLVWALVGRTLRPVERMRRDVATISGTQLDRRVPEPGTGDEIDRLAQTMNDMLDRIDDAARRQRRFVADASHELRSPLTRMRVELELDLADPVGADHAATLRSVFTETERMQRLVEDLLHLARNGDHTALRVSPVDLDDLVLSEVAHLRTATDLTIDARGVSGAQVMGDRDALERVVRNLADNAARYAERVIAFTVNELGDEVVLTVSDDGPGITADQHEIIFEAFARVDEARNGDDGGTGLGLAIVRSIVERHAGSVRVDPDHRSGTRIEVRLPAAAAAAAPTVSPAD